MNSVAQDLPNDRVKVYRIDLVARTEVEDLAVAAFPGRAASEHFTAFKPGEENDFLRRRDRKRLAVHFAVFNLEAAIDSLRDRMSGVANPEPFPLSRLAPGERTARAHQSLEDFRVMRRVQRDKSHPFPDTAEHAFHDGVLDLTVRSVPPPKEDVGLGEHSFRQAVLRFLQRGGANQNRHVFAQAIGDAACMPSG